MKLETAVYSQLDVLQNTWVKMRELWSARCKI